MPGACLAVGAGVAFCSILPMGLVFLGTRESTEYQKQEEPKFKDSILAAIKNKPFLFALGIFMLTYSALDIVQSTLLYFLKYHMNLEDQGDLIFGLLFVAALISLPFWDWAARRWNKQKAYIGGMVFFALMVIGLGILRPEWGLSATLVLAAAAGMGLGAIQVLTWAMIPDTVEWDELQTGQRHEGMYYSLVTLGRKIAASLALPMVLLVLEWTHYSAAAEVQPASAILGIRGLIGPIPAIFLLGGIILALFYPLSRERHKEVRNELSRRHLEEGQE